VQRARGRAATKVVYTQPPLVLARLLGRENAGWRVELAGRQVVVPCDASVDPALLDDLAGRGARVVLDTCDGALTIAGALTTGRPLEINRSGEIDVSAKSFRVTVEEEILLRGPGAFARVLGDEIELYGRHILSRAREIARILARMIKMN
jgi:hypothetical protein